MNKIEAVRAVLQAAGDSPAIFTTGYVCRIAYGLQDKDSHYYMTGSMGLAPAIAFGLAQALGTSVIVVDGDGALGMNPGALMLARQYPHLRLVHLVLDDGVYESTGGQASPAMGDIEGWAASLGYDVARVPEDERLEATIRSMLEASAARPQFLRLQIDAGGILPGSRVQVSPLRNSRRFASYCKKLKVVS